MKFYNFLPFYNLMNFILRSNARFWYMYLLFQQDWFYDPRNHSYSIQGLYSVDYCPSITYCHGFGPNSCHGWRTSSGKVLKFKNPKIPKIAFFPWKLKPKYFCWFSFFFPGIWCTFHLVAKFRRISIQTCRSNRTKFKEKSNANSNKMLKELQHF